MQNDNSKVKIIPAILEQDVREIEKKLKFAFEFAKIVQIDIADGIFVPNRTISVDRVAEIIQGVKLDIEWHLMVNDPLRNLPPKQAMVIFHFETVSDSKKTIENIKRLGHRAGIALNPKTPAEVLNLIHNQLALVTVMSVEPGFQGSPFVPSALNKIEEIKRRFPNLIVEIDGGVNENNLNKVALTGLDQIVVGSGIWKADDPAQKYRQLTDQLKKVS